MWTTHYTQTKSSCWWKIISALALKLNISNDENIEIGSVIQSMGWEYKGKGGHLPHHNQAKMKENINA